MWIGSAAVYSIENRQIVANCLSGGILLRLVVELTFTDG